MRHFVRVLPFTVLIFLLTICTCLHAETFKGPVLLPTAIDPGGVAAADINGDGNPDLIYVTRAIGGAQATLQVMFGQGDGTFVPGPITPLPHQVVCYTCFVNLADVNGDGRLDVIVGVSDQPDAAIAVLLGNGDGSFQPAIVSTITTPGAYPNLGNRMAAADINGDGALDLIVGDLINGRVYVLLGDKTGKFTLASTLLAGGYPKAVYLADLNGDGNLDVISTENLSAEITVFLGDGKGNFAQGVRYSTGAATNSMLLADLTGDGHPDVIASTYPNLVVVLKGNADGTFAPPVTIFQQDPKDLLVGVGDFNGDGMPDIVSLNSLGIGVMVNRGSMQFQAATPAVSGAADIATVAQADFNKDGHLDLAVGVEGGIALLLGNGDGTFPGPDVYDLGQKTGAATVADFNNDKHPDIAVAVAAPLPQLLLGNGTGKFTIAAAPSPGSSPSPISQNLVAADFNGDGKADLEGDLLPGNPAPTSPAVAVGNGNGTFQSPRALAKGSSIVGDTNGDGRSDMLSIQGTNIACLVGQKDGSFKEVDTPLLHSQFPFIVAAGDINGDGKTDLVIFDYGMMEVWLSNGDGSFSQSQTMDISAVDVANFAYGAAALVDLDQDGKVDLVVTGLTQSTSPVAAIFYGASHTTFQSPVFLSISHTYSSLTVADLNHDGLPDLILSDGVGIATIHNLGSRRFGQEDHFVAGAGFNNLTVADVNGDGFPDLIAPPANGSTVIVMLNQPNGVSPGGADTIESLTISPQPAAYAHPFTATASIQAAGQSVHTPTGSVTFLIDGAVLATVAVNNSTASYSVTTAISPGPHTVTAAYSGDKYFRSTSTAELLNVTPPTYSTSTVLTAAPATPMVSQTVRLSATVKGTSPDQAPFGIVTFFDGSQSLGAKGIGAGGVARLDTALLSAGQHTLTATYQGNSLKTSNNWEIFAQSTSASVPLFISSTATTTTLSAPTSSTAATVVTFTAKVTSAAGTPFGGITFLDGGLPLGTSAILADGSAAFSTADLAAGSHVITASFASNAEFAGSVSPAQTLSVSLAPANLAPALVVLNLEPSATSTGLSLVATVSSASGTNIGTQTGSVVFLDGGSIIGQSSVAANGQARLTLPSGINQTSSSHSFRASFQGSSHTAPAVSHVLSASWPPTGPLFQMTASLLPSSFAAQNVQVQIRALAAGDFQQVILSCTNDLPSGYVCNFTPARLSAPGNSLLTVEPIVNSTDSHESPGRSEMVVTLGIAFCCCLRSRKLWSSKAALFVVLLTAFTLLQSGCGTRTASTAASLGERPRVITIQATTGSGSAATVQSEQVTLLLKNVR